MVQDNSVLMIQSVYLDYFSIILWNFYVNTRANKAYLSVQDTLFIRKIMASNFWNVHGIKLNDYLEKGNAITGEYYVTLLDKAYSEIKEQRSQFTKENILIRMRIDWCIYP